LNLPSIGATDRVHVRQRGHGSHANENTPTTGAITSYLPVISPADRAPASLPAVDLRRLARDERADLAAFLAATSAIPAMAGAYALRGLAGA